MGVSAALTSSARSFFLCSYIGRRLNSVFNSFSARLSIVLLKADLTIYDASSLNLRIVFLRNYHCFYSFRLLLHVGRIYNVSLRRRGCQYVRVVPRITLFRFFLDLRPFYRLFWSAVIVL